MKTENAFSQPLNKMDGSESSARGAAPAEGAVGAGLEPNTRLKFVVGNWKMHTTAAEAKRLAEAIVCELGGEDRVAIAVCPPFPYLGLVGEILKDTPIALGAQNLYPEKEGAFTGEVSPTMLVDLGCKYVILGHSERRHILGEFDAFINQKVRIALDVGLHAILCVGETLEQRKAGQTESTLDAQLIHGLADLSPDTLNRLTVAYEPVWAIGEHGHQATPQQVQDSHALIRRCYRKMFGEKPAGDLAIAYGGSVKPENAVELLGMPDVDGALIGGASLIADQFVSIVQDAAKS